jgi:hypothetical protein
VSGDVTDKFVTTAFHPMPGKKGMTGTMLKFVVNLNDLATVITMKTGQIVTIQTKAKGLQFAIKGIDGMTLRSVITASFATGGAIGKGRPNLTIPPNMANP